MPDGACFICLDTSPPPVQCGCACRGDSGLAHVGCLVQAAESREANGGGKGGWRACRTCKNKFTGAVSIGLAEAQWLRVRDQPAESNDRLYAASILASSLFEQGKYEEAAQMQRELLEVQRRVPQPSAEHPTPGATRRMLPDTHGCAIVGDEFEANKRHRQY